MTSEFAKGSAPAFMLRAGVTSDMAFISETWLRETAKTMTALEMGRCFPHEQRRTIREVLARAVVRVACDVTASGAIWGYAILGHRLVYYVYVRAGMRRMGLARALLSDVIGEKNVTFTSRPSVALKLPSDWLYNPTRNYRGSEEEK